MTDSESYTIQMSGGPQDGDRFTFEHLPLLIGLKVGGVYSQTETVTPDGAHIFEFMDNDDPLTPVPED